MGEDSVVDVGFWFAVGWGFAMGYVARSAVLWARRRDAIERARERHPSTQPVHFWVREDDDGWRA